VYDGDNNDHDAAGAAGAARTARGWKCLIYAGFGQLDRNPELYLAQHLVELFVAGTVLEVGGDGLKPQQCRGLVELELVERVEGAAAMFDRPAAALEGILDPLQRNEPR
jgi:hypothetical protein